MTSGAFLQGPTIVPLPAAALLGALGAALIKAMISRSREYVADADGAKIAGSPHGLVSALRKLEAYAKRIPLQNPNPAMNNMFIIEPLTGPHWGYRRKARLSVRYVHKKERVLVTTLTKRMAEDLTDYLGDHGVRVRYLHSDIDTVERVEIIRDLRLGEFDVLVGINLLREGLDMPEVSLVAILDADREGYLRSDSSLIQTIGRAARNVRGKAILYADRITGSMERAMAETDRRRTKQTEYNREHGITPKTIRKAVADVMEGAYAGSVPGAKRYAKVAEEVAEYAALSPEILARKVKKLEKQMYQHAQNLEFEEAARVRDQIRHMQESNLGLVEAVD